MAIIRSLRPVSRTRIANELLTLGARVFGVAAGLGTSAITARALGPEDRGAYFYVIATAIALAQFGHLGTPAANTYFCAPEPGLARRLLRWTAALGVGASVILVVLFLIGVRHPLLSELAPSAGQAWLLPLTMGVLLLLMLAPLLAGLHAFGALNGLQIAYQLFLIIGFAAVAVIEPTVSNFLAVAAVGALLAVAAHAASTWTLSGAATSADLSARAWLDYGRRAYLILLLGALVPRIGIFAVKADASPEQLGYYSIAIQAFDALVLVPSSLATILFPTILRSGQIAWASCRAELLRMLILSVGIATAAALAMPWAVRLVFGEAFSPAASVALWFLPAFVMLSLTMIASQYLAALAYPRAVMINWLIAVLVIVAGCQILVPALGAQGAALASSLAYGVLATLMIWTARSHLPKA